MSKIKGDMEFEAPVNDTDAINLKYFNEKINELKALITTIVTEMEINKDSNKISKTSQLENDSNFVTEIKMKQLQIELLNKIISTL